MNKWFEQALYKTGDPMVNKHMKKCLTGKHQLTTDWLELEKSTKPNVGKDVAQSELWCFKMGIQIDTIILEKYLVSSTNIDVQAGFRKGRGTRDQLANIRWIIEKAREFQKTSISALLTMPKPLTVWITINCRNSERDGNTRPPDLPLEKSVCRSGSNI